MLTAPSLPMTAAKACRTAASFRSATVTPQEMVASKASTSTKHCRTGVKSRTRPPSRKARPTQSWPPLRTDTGSPAARAASTAVLAARAAGLPVSVRNGGQDWVGRALRDGGLVLDLTPVRQCLVDVEAFEATISCGVTVADLNDAAVRHALAAVIGNDGAVSMAGLILGGGYGPLMT